MSNNAHELSNRLLNALDNNYNVVDMHAVNEIISILEKINITKELLETTRLGKHVNELRRKTTEPTLARRAKVLVKRWRDLVIPAAASPAHVGSNRSSAERQPRRVGGTPITSPAAFARQVVSPAVPSPRPLSRPAWGGYESDSQDVILVDDDPPPAPSPALAPAPAPAPAPLPLTLNAAHKPVSSPAKRPPSPEAPNDDKKAKRDKKPKKRRGHSRAGSGAEAGAGVVAGAGAGAGAGAAWAARNGAHAPAHKKNGVRSALDPYAALVNRMPPAGAKKVKTTQELLAQIQSRGAAPRSPSPAPAAAPGSPDVLLIEPDPVESSLVKSESPLRNGGASPCALCPSPSPAPAPLAPLEDPRDYCDCTCGEEPDDACPAAARTEVLPAHVHALHHAYLPGINGTRAPLHPHQFAVRKLTDPDKPDLFTSIVPLYKYSDYADDYCVKNMSKVPLCTHLPWTEFAPAPPEPAPAPDPPPPRPYPVDDPAEVKPELEDKEDDRDRGDEEVGRDGDASRGEGMEVDVKVKEEPSERLKAPPSGADEPTLEVIKCESGSEVADEFASRRADHRTVERTKAAPDGRALLAGCAAARRAAPFSYSQTFAAPTLTLPAEAARAAGALQAALAAAEAATERDARGRPERPTTFAEWHECARLGDLLALPYVVID